MHNKTFMAIFRCVYLALDLWISGAIFNRKIDLFNLLCQLGTHKNVEKSIYVGFLHWVSF